jgi:hypothetical protein
MQNKGARISDEEWKVPRDNAWRAIMGADYPKAIRILTPVYKNYRRDFRVINFYASTLADYGECRPEKEKRKLKKRGCVLLRGLLRRLRGRSRELGYSTRNEYYYHSAQYDKQYRLGVECVRAGEKRGYYSQGVGAAWHAYGHARTGHSSLAEMWAKRAIRAWRNYFKFKADYYNAYVHYALALGIIGRIKNMEEALAKSAKLSGKPRAYREFEEVRGNISLLTRATR